MSAYNKFQDFVEQLARGTHNLSGTHQLRVALSNTAPVATNAVLADITQIAPGNGYTTGGANTTASLTETAGTARLFCTDTTFTASGGPMAAFRFVVLYNDTPTSPADPLIAWYDYGSALTLAAGETFTVDFDGTNGVFSLA